MIDKTEDTIEKLTSVIKTIEELVESDLLDENKDDISLLDILNTSELYEDEIQEELNKIERSKDLLDINKDDISLLDILNTSELYKDEIQEELNKIERRKKLLDIKRSKKEQKRKESETYNKIVEKERELVNYLIKILYCMGDHGCQCNECGEILECSSVRVTDNIIKNSMIIKCSGSECGIKNSTPYLFGELGKSKKRISTFLSILCRGEEILRNKGSKLSSGTKKESDNKVTTFSSDVCMGDIVKVSSHTRANWYKNLNKIKEIYEDAEIRRLSQFISSIDHTISSIRHGLLKFAVAKRSKRIIEIYMDRYNI